MLEVYEQQCFDHVHGWVSYKPAAYVDKRYGRVVANETLEEILIAKDDEATSTSWSWSTEWRLFKAAGVTDSDGWEYASQFERFQEKDRLPKVHALWCKVSSRK